MPTYTDLDIRMKDYEKITDQKLIRRLPVIIRLDGRSFHTFTRGFRKPFDDILIDTMQQTALYMCQNVQNCVLAYTQSDEISLLLIDYKDFDTRPWFGNRVQKMCSIVASMATMAFNNFFESNVAKENRIFTDEWLDNGDFNPKYKDKELNKLWLTHKRASEKGAMFDSRCFNLSKDEVTNYFFWRQQDASRNSIQMVGQANFSHKELQNKSCNQIQDMLMEQKGINWNDFPVYQKRGSCCIKVLEDHEGFEPVNDGNKKIGEIRCETLRSNWIIDKNIPMFKGEGRDYINELVFV